MLRVLLLFRIDYSE